MDIQCITSIFAAFAILSGVKLPSSSMRAGKNVPLPFTSSLAAACSDATVSARTLAHLLVCVENEQCIKWTNPPTAATSISPLTSMPSSAASLARSAAFSILAAAQKIATHVPTMQPEPVISPSRGCPLDRRTTVDPSETQSVTPVKTTMHPTAKVVY